MNNPQTTCERCKNQNAKVAHTCWRGLKTYADPRAIKWAKLTREIAEKAGR